MLAMIVNILGGIITFLGIIELVKKLFYKQKNAQVGMLSAEIIEFKQGWNKKGINFSAINATVKNLSTDGIVIKEVGVIIHFKKFRFDVDDELIPTLINPKTTIPIHLYGKIIIFLAVFPPYFKHINFKLYVIDDVGHTLKSKKEKFKISD